MYNYGIMAFQNPTEEFVYSLCQRSFLSLWSYDNPRRRESTKELCDILVVCEPHVIIFSVKYSELKDPDDLVAVGRWTRKTVEASVKAIYGAERSLAKSTYVIRNDGKQGLALPPLGERKVHRISVSLGGNRTIPITFKDWGKGFVHCFDDRFVEISLKELDTISDFIAYLEAKEELHEQERTALILGGEEALLAFYLHHGRVFPSAGDIMMLDDDLWEELSENLTYQRRARANEVSYAWDHLIEYLGASSFGHGVGETLSADEAVLRIMARETRFRRRILGKALTEFHGLAQREGLRARTVPLASGVTYVFFNAPSSYERQTRIAELGCRCFIARCEIPENKTVVGIGMNVEPAPQGYAMDLVVLSYPEWSPDYQAKAERMKKELGWNPQVQIEQIDEYPEE